MWFKYYNYLNLKVHFSKWTSSVQFYWQLLMFLWRLNWVVKTKWIFKHFASNDLGLKRYEQIILTKNGAWARCRRSVVGSMRRVQLWRVMQVAIDGRPKSVLLQLVNILNTLFKHWVGSWHSSLKRLNCWRKAVWSLIRYSWIFNAQLHAHLKKWTLKFKLLYPWNHINSFHEIFRICCVNTHI